MVVFRLFDVFRAALAIPVARMESGTVASSSNSEVGEFHPVVPRYLVGLLVSKDQSTRI